MNNDIINGVAAEDADAVSLANEGGKYVTFKTGNEYYGLKIKYVNEIVVLQEITEIPESEDYIKGLINLRGNVIPVIDVRLRFRKEPFEYDDRTCIIVINSEETVVGLIVEKIAEVVEIKSEDITPAPKLGNANAAQNKYVYAIGKVGNAVKLLLDPEKLIKYTEIPSLEPEEEEAKENEADTVDVEVETVADDVIVEEVNTETAEEVETAAEEKIEENTVTEGEE